MITIIELLPSISLGELRRRLSHIADSATVELHMTNILVGEAPVVDADTYGEFFAKLERNDVLEGGKI